jgi:hypothetical protein
MGRRGGCLYCKDLPIVPIGTPQLKSGRGAV